jgi:hypothetical protein
MELPWSVSGWWLCPALVAAAREAVEAKARGDVRGETREERLA